MTKSRDTADRVNDIVVDGSGNVGIGTSSPTLGKLQVESTTNNSIVSKTSSTTGVANFSATADNGAVVQVAQYGNSATGTTFGVSNANLSVIQTTTYGGGLASGLAIGNLANSAPIILGNSGGERMRIDSSGHAIIPAGVTLGTAAGVYNAANTLDDYEEGTFQPSIQGSTTAGVFTYGLRSGAYTKVGNMVNAQIGIFVSATTTPAQGDVTIIGLPFARLNNTSFSSGSIGWASNVTITGESLNAYVGSNATSVTLRNIASATQGSSLQGNQLLSSFYFFVTITYPVA